MDHLPTLSVRIRSSENVINTLGAIGAGDPLMAEAPASYYDCAMTIFDYSGLKHLHMGLAFTSALLFVFRGFAAVAGHNKPSSAYRVLVHLIDTLLLTTGLWLAYKLSLSPLEVPWLGTKISAIVLYILLGIWLMHARSRAVRAIAYLSALLMLAYIFVVAISKSPAAKIFSKSLIG